MKLSFAFSPCPNDTFMFEPIVNQRIDTKGIDFSFHLADVEELNQAAFKDRFDVTKLSFNAFTQLTIPYQLLNSGSALGRNCGPLLIAKRMLMEDQLKDARIAIPGENTTANFLLNFAFPNLNNRVPVLFSEIEEMILNDEAEAGVIIHENRFTYQEKGLVKLMDLGEHWENETGSPIPLGGIVIRRDLPDEVKVTVNEILKESVAYAFANKRSGLEYIRCHAQEMNEEVMFSHIDLYVNEFSKDIGEEGKKSVQYLFDHHPNFQKGQSYTTPLFVK